MSRERVESATNSWWGVPFVMPSSRAAVLVVSPIAVYSTRRSEPTLPDITRPLLSPIPMRKPSESPFSRSQALKRGRRTSSISRAAASARSA